MKLDTLKEKKELVSTALLIVSVAAVVLMLFKISGFFNASARAESAVQVAIKHSRPDSENMTVQSDKSKKVADALKKANLFSPPAPKKNPITTVMGIFGDEALINGKWYKAGDKVADAKILAVNPTSVETEWDGKKKTFNPIDGSSSSGSSGPSRSSRSPGRTSSSSSRPGRPGMVVTEGSRSEGRGGGPPGMGGMTREKMTSMSEAERDKFRGEMRAKYENMSDGEKEKFRAQMRERFGGIRGAPGGGDGRGRGGRPGGRQPIRINPR